MASCMTLPRKTSPSRSPLVNAYNLTTHWPGLIVRHTFLDVAPEEMALPMNELRQSRSCGDLPDILFQNDTPEQLLRGTDASGSVSGERTDETEASLTDETETPVSTKDCSDDGDSNSTTSARGSFSHGGLFLWSAVDVELDDSGSATPSPSASKPTAAARRRFRRRRAAAKEKDQSADCLSGDLGQALAEAKWSRRASSTDGAASPTSTCTGGDSRTSRSSSSLTSDFLSGSPRQEGGRNAWLQHLLSSASSNAGEILKAAYAAFEDLSLQNVVDTLHAIAKCAESEQQSVLRGTDKRLVALLSKLRHCAQGLNRSRAISRTVWSLGKLGLTGEDVVRVLAALSDTFSGDPAALESSSTQELSNTLWGLARLGSADRRCRCHAEQLVMRIIAVGGKRLREFTPQCLANSLWAIGKLGLRSQSAAAFVGSCLQEMCCHRHLVGFSAQGMANSLWACARLQLPAEAASVLCRGVAEQVRDEGLKDFLPQELSMTIWAVARITSRGGCSFGGSASRQQRRQRAPPDVERLVLAAAQEAASRLSEFSPQGLSNIGWALAAMELTREDCARAFLVAAAEKAIHELHSYSPQAIANLCWAVCRLSNASEDLTVHFFASAVALQAEHRMGEFEWQDLAGIVSAMNRAELVHLPQVHSFATALVTYASQTSCAQISTQALLNMAFSAAGLGVQPDALLPMVERMDAIFASDGGIDGLNAIDRRQWSEVKTHCCFQRSWYEDSDRGSSWSQAAALALKHNNCRSAFSHPSHPSEFNGHACSMSAVPVAMPIGSVQVWMPTSMI